MGLVGAVKAGAGGFGWGTVFPSTGGAIREKRNGLVRRRFGFTVNESVSRHDIVGAVNWRPIFIPLHAASHRLLNVLNAINVLLNVVFNQIDTF
jgi:hypothetical protein